MGWLIACEYLGGARVARSWGNGRSGGRGEKLLPHGSIVVDVELENGVLRPTRLIHYEAHSGWVRRFTLFLNPDGSISVEHRQGDAWSYVRVSAPCAHPRRLRVTYSWDGPERLGLLTAESIDTGAIRQAVQQGPVPLQLRDLEAMATLRGNSRIDSAVRSFAISDDWQRVGPVPTIAAGARIRTPGGYKLVEALRLGDLVVTQSGRAMPLRWVLFQHRPGIGFSAPIRLRAPYFGLHRDVTLAATHLVQAAGPDTEYLLGRSNVMIEAGRLLNHPGAARDTGRWLAPYYHLLFDQHAAIDIDGLWSESLLIGHLRDSGDILSATHLADIGAEALPLHRHTVIPPLAEYESLSVLDAISA